MIKKIFNIINIQNKTINKINIQNIQKNIQINIKLITYMFKIKLNKINKLNIINIKQINIINIHNHIKHNLIKNIIKIYKTNPI